MKRKVEQGPDFEHARIPYRTCIACGRRVGISYLLAIGKRNGKPVLNPGCSPRFAYICQDTACLQKAMVNKSLSKTLGISFIDSLDPEFKSEVLRFLEETGKP